MKANAIIFEQPQQVEFGEIDLPEPTSRDIVIDTEVCGISVGTERWAYMGKRAELRFPNVPGYMGVGRVVSSGAEAEKHGWQVGEYAYFFSSRFAGRIDGNSWMGSHVSRAVVDVCGSRGSGELQIHRCEKIPKGLPAEDAALLGLCAVAMRGIEMAVLAAGDNVLICGMGVIGQYALQICHLKGTRVTVTDIVDSRLEIAKALGCEHAINGNRQDLNAEAGKIAPSGFDVIIDTSSNVAVVNSMFQLLKLGGKFVFQGWYPPPTCLDLNALHQRLPSAYFPCAHSADAVGTALRWAAKGLIRSKPLVTNIVNAKNASFAYEMIGRGSDEFVGVLLNWKE